MTSRRIVLDANVLIRAVLGVKVSALIARYADVIDFCVPEIAFLDAAEHLPGIASQRGADPAPWLDSLDSLKQLVTVVPRDMVEHLKIAALERIGDRDPDDWPIVATALGLNCPIWTHDKDFFGIGVTTWTSERVEIYLRGD